MIPSIPHINKQSFETSGSDNPAGSKFFDFKTLINNCVYFNDGSACFRGTDAEENYGLDPDEAWVQHTDGHYVALKNHRTTAGHKKTYINPSTRVDIGFKAFRSSGGAGFPQMSGFHADTKAERVQLYVLPQEMANKRKQLSENQTLKDGHKFRCLPIRVKDGQIADYFKGAPSSGKFSVISPGDEGYPLIDVLRNNHPIPKEDGYYMCIFNFSYIVARPGVGGSTGNTGIIDDTSYQCYIAKVA